MQDGSLAAGDDIFLKHTEGRYTVLEVGAYTPHHTKLDRLNTGEIGLVICGIKTLRDAKVGDTLCAAKEAAELEPLSGFQEVKPMVFAGIFPVDAADYSELGESLEKLALNDASITWEVENSSALGMGYRCGSLAVAHGDRSRASRARV